MKVPTLFTPEIVEEGKMEQLIQGPKCFRKAMVDVLLESCEEYIEKQREVISYHQKYMIGCELADKIAYDQGDLEELSKRIEFKMDVNIFLGFYLSALTNNIIREQDSIILKLNTYLTGVGAKFGRGKLLVELPDVKPTRMEDVGIWMSGGELVLTGSVNRDTGGCMEGGEMLITGDAGSGTGESMKGGKITALGTLWGVTGRDMTGGILGCAEIKNIDPSCAGVIYEKDKQVWPR